MVVIGRHATTEAESRRACNSNGLLNTTDRDFGEALNGELYVLKSDKTCHRNNLINIYNRTSPKINTFTKRVVLNSTEITLNKKEKLT
jgi:hypothetical protein